MAHLCYCISFFYPANVACCVYTPPKHVLWSIFFLFQYERFLPQSGVCVLSTYAPIMFPSAPVLIFKESSAGHDLVASGSLLSVDPDRLVIKRAVLSGHPYKINKRSAVIRYMFYSRGHTSLPFHAGNCSYCRLPFSYLPTLL